MLATEDDNKPSPKHVEAAIWVILGRGFNSLRLHWFQWNPNPQVVQPVQLAGFLLSQLPVSRPFQKNATFGSNFLKLELAWAMQLS